MHCVLRQLALLLCLQGSRSISFVFFASKNDCFDDDITPSFALLGDDVGDDVIDTPAAGFRSIPPALPLPLLAAAACLGEIGEDNFISLALPLLPKLVFCTRNRASLLDAELRRSMSSPGEVDGGVGVRVVALEVGVSRRPAMQKKNTNNSVE